MGTMPQPILKNPSLKKVALALFLLVLAVTIFLFIAAFQQTQGVLMESTRNEGLTMALLASQQVNGDAMAVLNPGDEQTARYAAIYNDLNRIRRANPDIQYIYTMKKENGSIVFVVDADFRNPGGAALCRGVSRQPNVLPRGAPAGIGPSS